MPFALEFLFHEFNQSFNNYKTHKGYRLLAVNGSALSIAHNPNDSSTYFQTTPNVKGFNLLHLNAMHDLCNKIYVDTIVQPGKEKNEYKALTDMIDCSKAAKKVIIIADRGYKSYNVFAHIEQKGWKYVIRVKDVKSTGIASSLKLADKDEIDQKVNFVLTRKQKNEVKAQPELYKFLKRNHHLILLTYIKINSIL